MMSKRRAASQWRNVPASTTTSCINQESRTKRHAKNGEWPWRTAWCSTSSFDRRGAKHIACRHAARAAAASGAARRKTAQPRAPSWEALTFPPTTARRTVTTASAPTFSPRWGIWWQELWNRTSAPLSVSSWSWSCAIGLDRTRKWA